MAQKMKPWVKWVIAGGVLLGLMWIGLAVVVVVGLRGHHGAKIAPEDAAERQATGRAAFASSAPAVSPAGVADALAGLERFGAAIKSGDGAAFVKVYDVDRIMEVLFDMEELKGMSAEEKRGFKTGFSSGVPKMVTALQTIKWKRLEVRSSKQLGPSDVVLVTKMWLDNGAVAHMRWWLHESGGAWRVYDFEDFDSGIRTISAMAAASSGARSGATWMTEAAKLQLVRQAFDKGNLAEAGRLLKEMEKVVFPPQFDGLRLMFTGLLQTREGQYQEALASCDAALAANPDMPMIDMIRAQADLKLEKYDDAIAAAKRYAEALGNDAETRDVEGNANLALHKNADAAVAFRAALGESSDNYLSLTGLAKALDAGKKAELGEWIKKSSNPGWLFKNTSADLVRAGDYEGLRVLLASYGQVHPDSDVYQDYYEAEALAHEKKDKEALVLLMKAAPRAPADDQWVMYHQLALVAARNGAALEAYGVCTDQVLAFQLLANELMTSKDYPTLEKLAALHAKTQPDDLQRWRVLGRMWAARKNMPEAIKAYTAGLVAAKTAADEASFRRLVVQARYDAGDVFGTFAEISPQLETFGILAGQLSNDKRADDLEKLVGLLAAKFPDSALVPMWSAECKWLRADYAGCAAQLAGFEGVITADEDLKWRFSDLLVRSLVRTHKGPEALSAATRLAGDEKTTLYLLLGHAACGEETEAMTQMAGLLQDDEDYSVADFYDDPDLGPLLEGTGMAAARAKYPKPAK